MIGLVFRQITLFHISFQLIEIANVPSRNINATMLNIELFFHCFAHVSYSIKYLFGYKDKGNVKKDLFEISINGKAHE